MQKRTSASELFALCAEKLHITERAAAGFFTVLKKQGVHSDDLVVRLEEMAIHHKEILERFEGFKCYFPEVEVLREKAGQAVAVGEFYHAEQSLLQARENARAVLAEDHTAPLDILKEWQVSETEICTNLAMLHLLQYHYSDAVQFFQAAAAALPEERKVEQAFCLCQAGSILWDIDRYPDALSLYEQALFIAREIRDRNREAALLRDIGMLYIVQQQDDKALEYLEQCLDVCGNIDCKEAEVLALEDIASTYNTKKEYAKALEYLEQSLGILRETGEKEDESRVLNNIGAVYQAQGEFPSALEYFEQALALSRENEDVETESRQLNNIIDVYKAQGNYDTALKYSEQDLALMRDCGEEQQECVVLNNIGMIYSAKEDHSTALQYHEQSLEKAEKLGAEELEASIRANIAWIYITQDKPAKAEPYLSRAVEIAEELEHPDLENWRGALKEVCTELQKQSSLIGRMLRFVRGKET
ncbi:MAG: tetratricopeptide repeat protein [Candidatus Electrothrix sp. AU1_5]|nr:tetratricopeptide repeat protein [Candidatus Electrothrix gigas]